MAIRAQISKWIFFLLLLAVLVVWSPLASDAASRKARVRDEDLPATVFSCNGLPNNRPDLIQYGHIHSGSLTGVFSWSYGMSIELERVLPGLLSYQIKRDGKLVTKGTIKSTSIQYAMTAGGPWGVELHCYTQPE